MNIKIVNMYVISDYQNLPLQKEIKIYWKEQLPNVSNHLSNFLSIALLTGILPITEIIYSPVTFHYRQVSLYFL